MDIETLEKLIRLRDVGALTEEEFAERKARLMDGENGTYVETEAGGSGRRSVLSTVGLLTTIFGFLIVLYAGWIYDPTVTSSPDIGGSSVQDVLDSYERAKLLGSSKVYNNGLLNRQLILALLGVAISIVGSILYAASKVADAVTRRQ